MALLEVNHLPLQLSKLQVLPATSFGATNLLSTALIAFVCLVRVSVKSQLAFVALGSVLLSPWKFAPSEILPVS